MTDPRSKRRRTFLWLGVGFLFVLHHDWWWWDDRTLLFGFMPVGMAYHVAYSIAAACLWAAAVKFAWPSHIEEFAQGDKPAEKQKEKERAGG